MELFLWLLIVRKMNTKKNNNILYVDGSCYINVNYKRCYIGIVSEILRGCCVLFLCIFLNFLDTKISTHSYKVLLLFSIVACVGSLYSAYSRWKWLRNSPTPIIISKQKIVLPIGTDILCKEIQCIVFSTWRYGISCYLKTKHSKYEVMDWQYYVKPKEFYLLLKQYVPSLIYKRTWWITDAYLYWRKKDYGLLYQRTVLESITFVR